MEGTQVRKEFYLFYGSDERNGRNSSSKHKQLNPNKISGKRTSHLRFLQPRFLFSTRKNKIKYSVISLRREMYIQSSYSAVAKPCKRLQIFLFFVSLFAFGKFMQIILWNFKELIKAQQKGHETKLKQECLKVRVH